MESGSYGVVKVLIFKAFGWGKLQYACPPVPNYYSLTPLLKAILLSSN
jgi:hypothetical protein